MEIQLSPRAAPRIIIEHVDQSSMDLGSSHNFDRQQLLSPPMTVKHAKNSLLRLKSPFTKKRNTSVHKTGTDLNMNDYMVRFDKHTRKNSRLNESRDLTFEPSCDMNSDLAESSIGFSRNVNQSAIERLNKFKSQEQSCSAKKLIKQRNPEANALRLPSICQNANSPPKSRSQLQASSPRFAKAKQLQNELNRRKYVLDTSALNLPQLVLKMI